MNLLRVAEWNESSAEHTTERSIYYGKPSLYEPLAQLVEHLTFNQRVEGSSPSWLTILYAGVAELADAPDLGSGAARRGGSTPFTRTTKYQLQSYKISGMIVLVANLSYAVVAEWQTR